MTFINITSTVFVADTDADYSLNRIHSGYSLVNHSLSSIATNTVDAAVAVVAAFAIAVDDNSLDHSHFDNFGCRLVYHNLYGSCCRLISMNTNSCLRSFLLHDRIIVDFCNLAAIILVADTISLQIVKLVRIKLDLFCSLTYGRLKDSMPLH